MNRNRGSIAIVVFIVIIVIAVVATSLYLGGNTNSPKELLQNITKKINNAPASSLKEFLPGSVFVNYCASEESGLFKDDGTLPASHGRDFVPNDTRPSATTGNWIVNNNLVSISGSSLSDGDHKMKFVTYQGMQLAVEDHEGCGIIAGPRINLIRSYIDNLY